MPAPPAAPSWPAAPNVFVIVVGLYLVGSAACAALLLVGQGLLLWIRATGRRPPLWLNTDYQELANKANVPAAELLESQRCSRPISWGLLRPVIVLPHRLCREANRKLVRAILLHELGHVARRDAWGNLLFCLASPLLYCHPLYWWLRREWNLAAELVADDWAAWQTGKDAYVEELMDLARTSTGNSFPFVGATAVFSSPSQFYRRMQMLLAREQPLTTRTSVLWQLTSVAVAMLGIVLASSLGGIRPAIAQDKPASSGEALPVLEAPVETKPELPAALDPLEPPKSPDAPKAPEPPTAPVPPVPMKAEEPAHAGLIQELRAEQVALEARLQALQARLKALGVAPPALPHPRPTPRLEAGPRGTITLTRVEADGTVWMETWSADERGQPGQLVKREAAGKLPGKVTTKPAPEGKVLKAFEGKDGSITVHLHDGVTSKRIEVRPEQLQQKDAKPHNNLELPGSPSLPAGSSDALPANPRAPTTSNIPLPTTRGQERPQGSSSHRELDLVSLATSYADAVGNLEAAQAKLTDFEGEAKRSPDSIPKQEITSARLAVSAAQRKEQLLQRIAKVALDSVSKELDRATQLHKSGVVSAADLEEAQTRTEILKQILSTQPGNQGSGSLRRSPGKLDGESELEQR